MCDLTQLISLKRKEAIKKAWYKFTLNKLSAVGLVIVVAIIFLAIFAPFIVPYPADAGYSFNFALGSKPPSWAHLFGTDDYGRDVLSRVVFGFRYSLLMAVVVLSIVVPVGCALGLLAGYFKGTLIEQLIMRITDIFVAVPALILAMAVCAVLTPSLINAMLAITVMWWAWYCRLTYGVASSFRNEFFVQAAQVTGASTFHIVFREILPNCLGTILTRATLDVGIVILLGASLSFVGLGAQPPTPDLGTMIAQGYVFMPQWWWMTLFPAFAILLTIVGFNLVGDGVRDMFATEAL